MKTVMEEASLLRFARLAATILSVALGATGCSPNNQASSADAASLAQRSFDFESCASATGRRFKTFVAGQLTWYATRSRFQPPVPERSKLAQGTNGHAIVIVHGFNSIPANHDEVIEALNAKGFTVIAPLLAGWGSDAEAANMSTYGDWTKSVNDAIAVVSPCHTDITLVGHSAGGIVVTDGVTSGAIAGVSKLVIMAPFYRSATIAMDALIDQVSAEFPTMSANVFKDFSGFDAYEFLPVPKAAPGEPEPAMPLKALQLNFTLQDKFNIPVTSQSRVPALLVVSKADSVIDNRFAIDYVKAKFALPSFVLFKSDDDIGHSFQHAEANKHFAEMIERISAHALLP